MMIQVSSKETPLFDCNLQVMGRKQLELMSLEPFSEGVFVISITDSDDRPVALTNKPAGLLRLVFDDVGNEDFPISCHVMDDADEEDLEIIENMFSPITGVQAEQIASFIYDNLDNMQTLICQCEFGQSRSAAVAAAVLQHFTGDASSITKSNRFCPNALVVSKVSQALTKLSNTLSSEHTVS